jgi:hypothetical protein
MGFRDTGFGVFGVETVVNDCYYGSGMDLFCVARLLGRSPGAGLLLFLSLLSRSFEICTVTRTIGLAYSYFNSV